MPVDPRLGLLTVRRNALQLAADSADERVWSRYRRGRTLKETEYDALLRDLEDDMHSLAERWVEIKSVRQDSTAYCPVCGSEWERWPLILTRCCYCRALHRIHATEDL